MPIYVKCPKCGKETDRIYKLPSCTNDDSWMCEDCIFKGPIDMAHHWDWKPEDFVQEGIEITRRS